MSRIMLITEFELRAKDRDPFLAAANEHAKQAEQSEPGCERFDVAADREDLGLGVLLVVYQDEAALQAHRETPHLAAFFEAISAIDVRWRSGVYDLAGD